MIIYILLVLLSAVNFNLCDYLTVTTKYGKVRGRVQIMHDGGTYYAWQGIPYAAPPVGKLRFQAPVAPSTWSDVKETIRDSNTCYQVKTDSPNQSEDCLYINVYVPSKRGLEKFPVLVWIYGGAFRGGHASFYNIGPDRFISEGVIIVTFNYRVGPWGFTSTADTVIPGNAGLKDQSFALKWTYDNIEAFGGDPKKIIIAGESAGSASVGYQILSTKNQGLFRGAIQQSGSPLNEWAYIADPKPYVSSLISAIDPNAKVGRDSRSQLAYLQGVSAALIHAASRKTTPALTLPVIEPEHSGAFITQKMFEAFAAGNYNKVPVIIGCNSEEEDFILHSTALVRRLGIAYDRYPHLLVPTNMPTPPSKNGTLAADIKKIYIHGTDTFEKRFDAVIRFRSDSSFTRGVIKQGELMSSFNDVYFYIFSFDGVIGGWNKTVVGAEKVSHGEDLNYIWVHRGRTSTQDLHSFPASVQLTSERLIKMWSNFAKNLNPTPEKSVLLQNIIWPKVKAGNYQYLDINKNLVVKTTPKVTYPLWKTLYETYGKRPYVTY